MSRSVYVELVVKAVEEYVLKRKRLQLPNDLPSEMLDKRAGVFVSLKIKGQLRGCIGTIEPQESCIAEEIITNAISACSKDPRFMPVKPNELPLLEYSVDILSEPVQINSIQELDVKKYGVIVEAGNRRGLLLPDLEGVDSIEQQVSIAMRKAGIPENTPINLYRFEVIRYY
ncbi:MAG: AmmeMemoRadiSam system protein A [Armatimonadota bacterium]